jgi:hypothetical protein
MGLMGLGRRRPGRYGGYCGPGRWTRVVRLRLDCGRPGGNRLRDGNVRCGRP